MREVTCDKCGATVPLQSSFKSGADTYCEGCVYTVARETKENGQTATYARNTDPSVCALCGTDSPTGQDFRFRKKLPFCEKCGPKVEKWPYPRWLKLSLAGLILLLAVSLIYGRRYFHAGREMYVGERLVNAAQFEQAIPHLQEAVRIAPISDKAVLLLAKAALKSGDTEIAAKALSGHDDGKFEDGNDADFLEVKTLWERALGALKTAKQAVDLEQQDGKEVEAAKLMHQAAAQYPESKGLASQLIYFDQGAAFSEKNYDRFLALAEQAYDKEPNGMNKAAIASAWACKYAVNGNAEFKQNAEQILEQAQQMAKGNAEQEKAMEEFLPRLRYRLDTRVIVSPQEYNKRFRSGEKGK